MILADTSVWADHIHAPIPRFHALLLEFQILTHPFVIGEIACGNLRDRSRVLGFFLQIPSATVAEHSEALRLVEEQHLWGTGISWIDVHLLASALLTGCLLWTADRRLQEAARHMKVAYA